MTSFSRDLSFVPNKLQDTAFIKVSHHAIPRSVNRFVHLSVGLLLLLLHCCFTSTVNIYGHVGTVS